jgi:phosphate transport system substrate-binding protein
MSKGRSLAAALPLWAGLLSWSCAGPAGGKGGERPVLRYVGSSTIAHFIRDAEPVYGAARFDLDTEPESAGGEIAIVEGRADLAGVAGVPRSETLEKGIAAVLLGRDAIAAVVHPENPVEALTIEQLKGIFTGSIRNWKEVGGRDLEIVPLITGPESATRSIFRSAVLGAADYTGCRTIRPDGAIPQQVRENPGGIGQISFSFINQVSGANGVRALAVEGEHPGVTNFKYPIARPLYLLHRGDNAAVEAFAAWTQSDEGQRTVMKRFVGVHVLGGVRPGQPAATTGTLIIYTETYPVYDGGIYYYPHRPYTILSRHGERIRRVPNHRGENDESPTRVELPPGTYLIRPETRRGEPLEFFVTVEAGKTTAVDVEEFVRSRGGP